MPVKLDIKFDPAEWQGFLDTNKSRKAITDVYLTPATKFMALGASEGLKKILSSRVAGISVKASGKSARNLFVARLSGGGLHGDSHAVYEGPLTSGNYYIRAGSRKGRPRTQNIMNWMMDKGMSNFTQNMNSPPQPGAPRLTPGQPKSKRSDLEEIAWAIASSIAKKGTSVAHKPLYPGGQKRYDYVTYSVVKLKMLSVLFTQLKAQGLPGLHKIMVGYWKTGRYNANSAYTTTRPRTNFTP